MLHMYNVILSLCDTFQKKILEFVNVSCLVYKHIDRTQHVNCFNTSYKHALLRVDFVILYIKMSTCPLHICNDFFVIFFAVLILDS